jgi:hypothetical protein
MIRAATLVLALALAPTPLHAQDAVFTVTVPSAEVHAGPSMANPIVGHVSRGTQLPVSRNLGSWVRVSWPGGRDGIGYVHVTMGRIAPANAAARPAATAPAVTRTPSTAAPAVTRPPATAAPQVTRPPATEPARPTAARPLPPRSAPNRPPASHIVGVGGLVGLMNSIGGTARVWDGDRLAIQVGVMRDVRTSDVAEGRVTSVQLEPGLVYALFDRVTDYVWFRPYLGSSVGFRHQTFAVAGPLPRSESAKGIGVRVFAGSELMFASAPRFGLSVDVGYRRFPTPYQGFETEPLSASIAAHWYIK